VVYLDNGFCKYGQIFDPTTGRCRDIYCQELNYKYNGTKCIPDENKAVTDSYKPVSDIDLLLPLSISMVNHNERGNFSKHLNSRMNETCTSDWTQMIHETLQGKFNLSYTTEISKCDQIYRMNSIEAFLPTLNRTCFTSSFGSSTIE
jgi:hypothetical protein